MANVQPGPSHSSTQNDPQALSWEGDRMFNIYIYDYCFKRGFRKTARELLVEADIPAESQPPINAKQGLLFEWWSVFWVLFTAKASGNGSEDALLYTQHQSQQQANNRARAGQPGPGPRPINGLPMSGRPFPNGIPNGVTGFPNGSAPPGQSFQPPPMPGQPRQPLPGNPRGSVGSGPPFPSPTMSHSPQNSVSGPHPSLGQSPHLGARMAPPPSNGMQGPPGYPMNRPPSRTASPGNMAGMMHSRSPSMSARQPPMPPQDPLTMELMRVPPNQLTTLKDELGLSGKEITSMNMEEKQRVHNLWRTKGRKPGPSNAAAGPSSMNPPRRAAGKRNSTSPREDVDLPGTGSPPSKKPRRSPVENHAYPHPPPGSMSQPSNNMAPPGGPGGPGPGQGPSPGQQSMVGMRPMTSGGAPMNGFPPTGGQVHMGGPPPMGNSGPPHPMNPMSPPMTGMHGQPGMMTPQMSMNPPRQPDTHYRNSLATFHRGQLQNTGGSPSHSHSDPSFGVPGGPNPSPQFPGGPGGPNSRMPKPGSGIGGIMPPPSPGLNKDLLKENMMKMGDSPRAGMVHPPPNSAMTPSASGGNSSTPVPPGGPGPGQGGPLSGLNPSQNPTPNNSNSTPLPPPPNMDHPSSASSMLGNLPLPPSHMPGMMSNGMSSDMFSTDFMNDITTGLDTFDSNIFRDSGDLNFERDFEQWFNPNEQALDDPLDHMK